MYRADPGQGFFHGVGALVHGEHLGAFLGKAYRYRAAIAPAGADAARAGDDDDFSLQSLRHDLTFLVWRLFVWGAVDAGSAQAPSSGGVPSGGMTSKALIVMEIKV